MDHQHVKVGLSRGVANKNEEDMDLRRGPWTVEEDFTLMNYIAHHGEGRWNSLARCAGNSFNLYLCVFYVGYFHVKKWAFSWVGRICYVGRFVLDKDSSGCMRVWFIISFRTR